MNSTYQRGRDVLPGGARAVAVGGETESAAGAGLAPVLSSWQRRELLRDLVPVPRYIHSIVYDEQITRPGAAMQRTRHQTRDRVGLAGRIIRDLWELQAVLVQTVASAGWQLYITLGVSRDAPWVENVRPILTPVGVARRVAKLPTKQVGTVYRRVHPVGKG